MCALPIFGNFNSNADITVTMALHTYELRKEEPIEYDLDESGNRIIRGSKPVVEEPEPVAENVDLEV